MICVATYFFVMPCIKVVLAGHKSIQFDGEFSQENGNGIAHGRDKCYLLCIHAIPIICFQTMKHNSLAPKANELITKKTSLSIQLLKYQNCYTTVKLHAVVHIISHDDVHNCTFNFCFVCCSII